MMYYQPLIARNQQPSSNRREIESRKSVSLCSLSPSRSRARMGWSEDWSLVVGVLEPALHQSGRGSGIM